MKDYRPGGGTLAETADGAGSVPTPGKQTLTETLGSPKAPPLTGGPGLDGSAKIEGGTFFSGPDATLSNEVPAVATPDKTDADYEKTMGIDKAIADKKMSPVAGVNGQSLTATGCAGKKDGKVTFTFDRAYIGDYDYPAAGKPVRGVHVSISVALANCGEHKDVKLVQVLRYFTKKDGKVTTADPKYAKRRERAGWNDDKAKSKGWFVDGLDTDTTPFYVSDELYGNHGTDKKAAKLRDSPGSWTTDTNIGKEFRTCAVSYADGKGTVLACVDWGYYIDDKGAATFYPATPTAYVGATQEVGDAADRWDGISGNTKANLTK